MKRNHNRIRFHLALLCLLALNLCQAQVYQKGLSEVDYKIYTSIEEGLLSPDSVRYLSLKHKKLKKLPSEIFLFKNLEILDLSKNKLNEIPEDIQKLSKLREISLANNQLTTLPIQIGNLTELRKIIAFQNNIALLPTTMGKLLNLELLDLWSNEIESFPDEIKSLTNLKYVDLRGIMMSDEHKSKIKSLLPQADIQFSMGCNCLK
ncbi:MAG TPA: leucine-rich repeat domain-containing protein [Bacteroidia bacterium]|nr:leucine-rich repeat domain-containing protein [Bacteroidia bacterium]